MPELAPSIAFAYSPRSLRGASSEVDLSAAAGGEFNLGRILNQLMGEWAIEPSHGFALTEEYQRCDLLANMRGGAKMMNEGEPVRPGSAFTFGEMTFGKVMIENSLTKHAVSFGGPGMIAIGRTIDAMANDSGIDAIVLEVDSPGGTVSGTQELAEKIIRARQRKPVVTWVRDLCASAAVWIGCSADAVFCNVETATIGSIGTYMGVYDESERFEKAGIKAYVIAARADREDNMKGTGMPGTKITEKQIAKLTAFVDSAQDQFSAGVAKGRGVDVAQIEAIANGQVWHASDQQASILHDGIATWEEVAEHTARLVSSRSGSSRRLIASINEPASKEVETVSTDDLAAEAVAEAPESPPEKPTPENSAMSPEKDTTDAGPKSATIAELKAEFPKAGSDFILEQAESGATMSQATKAYAKLAEQRAEAAEAEAAEVKKKAAEAALENTVASGRKINRPLGDGGSVAAQSESNEDPAKDVVAKRVREMQKARPGLAAHEARKEIFVEDPELRTRLVVEQNIKQGRRRAAMVYASEASEDN